MNLATFVIVFFSVTMLLMGQTLREDSPDFTAYDYTDRITWNSSVYLEELDQNPLPVGNESRIAYRIRNLAYRTGDWLGYSSMEYSKLLVEIGYAHPEYGYRFMWNLLRVLIYVWAFSLVLSILTPTLALLYLGYKGIKRIIGYFWRDF